MARVRRQFLLNHTARMSVVVSSAHLRMLLTWFIVEELRLIEEKDNKKGKNHLKIMREITRDAKSGVL